jgi:hypothetical protein
MRVVSMGDAVGPHLLQAANDSGGAAAAVGWGSDAALRAVDILSTTFAEQYRLRGTMPAPGPVTVRLTLDGRSYEATIPDVGVAATTSTTATTPTTATTVAVATVPATAAANPTMGPGGPTSSGEGSSTPVVEASLAIAALALIVAVVVTQRRRSRHRALSRAATSRRR